MAQKNGLKCAKFCYSWQPQESTRRFKIALSELDEVGWLPNTVADIRREARLIKVQTVKKLPSPMEHLRLSVYRRKGTMGNSGQEWLYRTVLKTAIGLPETIERLHAEG